MAGVVEPCRVAVAGGAHTLVVLVSRISSVRPSQWQMAPLNVRTRKVGGVPRANVPESSSVPGTTLTCLAWSSNCDAVDLPQRIARTGGDKMERSYLSDGCLAATRDFMQRLPMRHDPGAWPGVRANFRLMGASILAQALFLLSP